MGRGTKEKISCKNKFLKDSKIFTYNLDHKFEFLTKNNDMPNFWTNTKIILSESEFEF